MCLETWTPESKDFRRKFGPGTSWAHLAVVFEAPRTRSPRLGVERTASSSSGGSQPAPGKARRAPSRGHPSIFARRRRCEPAKRSAPASRLWAPGSARLHHSVLRSRGQGGWGAHRCTCSGPAQPQLLSGRPGAIASPPSTPADRREVTSRASQSQMQEMLGQMRDQGDQWPRMLGAGDFCSQSGNVAQGPGSRELGTHAGHRQADPERRKTLGSLCIEDPTQLLRSSLETLTLPSFQKDWIWTVRFLPYSFSGCQCYHQLQRNGPKLQDPAFKIIKVNSLACQHFFQSTLFSGK